MRIAPLSFSRLSELAKGTRAQWALVLLSACSPAHEPVNPLTLKASRPHQPPQASAASFRDAFFRNLAPRDARRDFARMVLVPDAQLYKADQGDFDKLESHVRRWQPEDLLRRSIAEPPRPAALAAAPRGATGPRLTIVVIPGLASEFVAGDLFSEVVSNSRSAYAREVAKAFARAATRQRVDHHYSLAKLGEVEAPLLDLIKVGSIDDESGNPVVQVIAMHPMLGSLESLGTIRDYYPIFKRRLDKYFAIVGTPSLLYLSGHSRGANLALDFLSRYRADPDSKAWTSQIAGLVALNGAMFGSSYADAFYQKGQRPQRFHQQLADLTRLKETDSITGSWDNRWRSSGDLLSLANEMLFGTRVFGEDDWTMPSLDLKFGLPFLRRFDEQLQTESYFSDYPLHIRRVKRLATAAEVAIRELTHNTRLNWWRQHTIPAELFYGSLSAVMASPESEKRSPDLWQRALGEGPAMGRQDLDYTVMRDFNYDYVQQSHITLNDGLVGIHESTFWPTLHQRLNPKQAPYQAAPLAVFGGTHMAIVYPSIASEDEDHANRFPRRALLRTLAEVLPPRPPAVAAQTRAAKPTPSLRSQRERGRPAH